MNEAAIKWTQYRSNGYFSEGGFLKRLAFPKIKTFDSSATPKDGEVVVVPKAAEIDLSAIKEKLADAVKEQEANDPKLLRKRIADLEAAASRAAVPIAMAAKHIFTEQDHKVLELFAREIGSHANRIANVKEEILAATGELIKGLESDVDEIHAARAAAEAMLARYRAAEAPQNTRQVSQTVIRRTPAEPRTSGSAGLSSLGGPERKLLTICAQNANGVTVRRLAVTAGYAQDGGGFRNPLGRIRSAGYVEPGDPVRITPAGAYALGKYEPLPTGEALVEWWLTAGRLSGPEKKILSAVRDGGPMPVERLAAACGYEPNGGGFRNPLGRLRTLELITRGNTVDLSEDLRA